ncbi:unnamed protein product [Urochloa decumbens]|uniref:F-box domain-containing protein n=1 Tax=Urochloa decumbens TaxID=240449 RepID=A0ABC9GEC4_9POAL
MDLLPEELLVEILRRLPPRPLAVCRSVSKGLRATIDSRGLLLAIAHRVPRGVRGVFVNYAGQDEPYFFSRPERAAPRIDAELRFLPPINWRKVLHSSNGLLLVKDRAELYVCNPATRRWAQLPPRPESFSSATAYLVFDPTVSLHYEVISFSKVPLKPKVPIQPDIKRPSYYQCFTEYTAEEITNLPLSLKAKYDREAKIKGLAEWPPSSYVAQVFSSRTGQWEERAYVREDDVAVTLSDVWSDPWTLTYHAPRCGAVYWRGAFYLHCRGGFVMRLSLLEQKYRVIKTPSLDNVFTPPRLDINDFLSQEGPHWSKEDCLTSFERQQDLRDSVKPSMHLGKSEHGIYYTALRWHQLQVWLLHEASESRPMLEWELKHKDDIELSFLQHYMREDRENIEKPWSLDRGKKGPKNQVACGWDSSDDSGIDREGEDGVYNGYRHYNMSYCMDLLGYHPSKEIAFLGDHFEGFAYYLGSSKLQYLDDLEEEEDEDLEEEEEEGEGEDTNEDEDLEEEEEEGEDTDEDEA